MTAEPAQKFVRDQTRARLEKFSTELKRAAKSPADADAVHDLRVSIRRFTQCLRTFGAFFRRSRRGKIRRRVRKLMERCGAARNCDIALDLMRQTGLAGDTAAARLHEQRRRANKRMARHLAKWRARKIAHGWRRDLHVVSAAPGEVPREDAWHNVRRKLPELAVNLFAAGDRAAAPGTTHHAMHQFRLEAKRFRYTIELFQPLLGDGVQSDLDALRGLQDKLGLINDCVTTLDLVQGHRRAEIAVRKLLKQRETDFRLLWKGQFDGPLRSRWMAALTAPDPQVAPSAAAGRT